MVKEAYISYETAKFLKEKGFDAPCKAYYREGQEAVKPTRYDTDTLQNWNEAPIFYSCPTQQMAMAWLRKRHNVDIDIHSDCGMLGIKQYTPYQFTGLRDKNGREIYEGDIIRFGEMVLSVRFHEKESCFIMQKRSSKQWYHIGMDDIVEVIGNIHDNPELIKRIDLL